MGIDSTGAIAGQPERGESPCDSQLAPRILAAIAQGGWKKAHGTQRQKALEPLTSRLTYVDTGIDVKIALPKQEIYPHTS